MMKLNSLQKAFGLKFQGKWVVGATYRANDVVLYSDGLLYVASDTHKSNYGATVPTAGTDWETLDDYFDDNYVASLFVG